MRNIKTLDSINIVLRKRLINRLRSASVMSSTAWLRTGKKASERRWRLWCVTRYFVVTKWLHRYSIAIN